MGDAIHVVGDGVAGLSVALALCQRGAEVIVHGDRRAHVAVHTLVHRHAGRSFRTTELGDAAWKAAAQWHGSMAERGAVARVRMLRPASSKAGGRLRKSLEHAPDVREETHPLFGECFAYEPAFVVDVAATLRVLLDDIEQLGGRFETERVDPPPGAVAATGAALKLAGVVPYGGQLTEFAGEIDVAVSGGGIHAVPTPDGVCVGATWWPADAQMSDDEAAVDLRDRVGRLGLEVGEVLNVWSGLRAVNELDRRPVVGRLGQGFVVGGLGTRGWFWAPLLAELVADLVLDGKAVRADLDVARLARQT